MTTIQINASRQYDVVIGNGLLHEVGARSAPLIAGRSAVIVSDSNVFPLYGETVTKSLTQSGFTVTSFVFPAGEEHKNYATLLDLLNFLTQCQLTRSDAVFALGGGVTGDMAGLAASLYLRGIPCVQLPTSLLSVVDSSVGGKTAVNLPAGKNQMGTFTQPHLVLCDTDALATLPTAVYAEGWAEIIKYGMIFSRPLLNTLLSSAYDENLEEVIAHCVTLKRDVVAVDERDTGERQLLNFGHTLGHAVENCGNYQLFHGEGVAIGMAIMTRACVAQGNCEAECLTVLNALLEKFHLPSHTKFASADLLLAARADKKRSGDSITLVVPTILGNCALKKTNFSALEEILRLGM